MIRKNLCSSELNTLLVVPNKAITDLDIFVYFIHLWASAWPVRPNASFPLGIAGFVTASDSK